MQNWLGYKTFEDVFVFKSMFPAVLMTVSLVECAILVKLFYENKGNASAAVCEFRGRKNLRRGPVFALTRILLVNPRNLAKCDSQISY